MTAGGTLPSCREVVDGLPEWSEGALGGGAREPYERHLEVCPPCGSLARTYQAVGALARAALDVEMPPRARERLRRALLRRVGGR
ncbi:MAG TPA: zf-HC2 domain-containing protein [Anaeromyxobacteraceae bacterium]